MAIRAVRMLYDTLKVFGLKLHKEFRDMVITQILEAFNKLDALERIENEILH